MLNPSAIFIGSKPGSVVALSMMLERGWDIRHVVVSPKYERPWIPGPPLREFAEQHGLSVLTSQKELPASDVDFVISYMSRYLVTSRTRQLATRAAVNFHPGPLPEFGGWAFYNVAILENSKEYGCTCHHMDEGFDSGPLLKVSRFSINPLEETAISLERKTQYRMVRLFGEFCLLAESGATLPSEEQDRAKVRYMTKGEFDSLKEIPECANQETVDRYARAFWYPPYQCAFIRRGDTKMQIAPQSAMTEFAGTVHVNDLLDLQRAARDFRAEQHPKIGQDRPISCDLKK